MIKGEKLLEYTKKRACEIVDNIRHDYKALTEEINNGLYVSDFH